MFSNLPASWLICIGMVLCLILLLLIRKIRIALMRYFKPFKKGKTHWCKVIAVSDGDTLTCYRLNLRRSQTKLRFAYIDAPSRHKVTAQSRRV